MYDFAASKFASYYFALHTDYPRLAIARAFNPWVSPKMLEHWRNGNGCREMRTKMAEIGPDKFRQKFVTAEMEERVHRETQLLPARRRQFRSQYQQLKKLDEAEQALLILGRIGMRNTT